ncbi:MAG TPA: hypothetical protein DD412_08390 [Holosporales bacterium]|nr:hypothetical protein [Holosporales bacterium]
MTIGKHPLSLHTFSLVHFFERFSYYGILSLLVLYLSTKLNFSDARSYAILGVYGTLTYATPVIGGYIADRFIGFYAALWFGLSFILLGHLSIFSTQFSSFGELGLFFGLGCVVTGSGFYKSNMNALIGNLYDKENILKDAAYTIFYVYQNAGSFLAPLICGYVGLKVGWSYGFSLAGLAGICALITLYVSGKFKRKLHSEHSLETDVQWKTVVGVLMGGGALALLLSFVIFYGEDTLDFLMAVSVIYLGVFIKYVFSVPKDQRKNMMIILFGIIAVALSGALIGHGETVFTLLMDRNVDTRLLSFEVPVTFIQAVDPLTIVIFGPLFAVLWRFMSKKSWHLSGITKTLIGFGIIVLSYKYLEVLCISANEDHLIPVLPFILGLSVLAASDILIYPNVLTFCSRFTPKGLTGVVMGFIVFGMSLSKLIGTYLARLASVDEETPDFDLSHSLQTYKEFFSSMTLISLITLIVLSCFILWTLKKRKTHGS